MSSSFASLKKSRNESFDKLTQEAAKLNSKKDYTDARFWKPTIGDDKNGSAIIRFLPAPKGEDIPWARIWKHSFKGPGGWYIENSLSTLGKADPVGEVNSLLWETGIEANKAIARNRKRSLSYISWIYVVSDPKKPENNNKVFLFSYGKKIHDKITELSNPIDPTETKIYVSDFWEGCNFRLKIKDVAGFRNYDSSSFDSPKALSDNDKTLEDIWNQCTPLAEFTDPKNFKSYDELKARFNKVVGIQMSKAPVAESAPAGRTVKLDDEDEDTTPPFETDDTDDALAKFRSLLEED